MISFLEYLNKKKNSQNLKKNNKVVKTTPKGIMGVKIQREKPIS